MDTKFGGVSFNILTINFVNIWFFTITKMMEYCKPLSNLLFYLYRYLNFDLFLIFLRIEIEKYLREQDALTCEKNKSHK